MTVQKQYAFNGNQTLSFEFCSFVPMEGTALCRHAGQRQPLRLPDSRPPDGKPLTHQQPFCSSPSVQYSIHSLRRSALYDQRGFVLDDFVQP